MQRLFLSAHNLFLLRRLLPRAFQLFAFFALKIALFLLQRRGGRANLRMDLHMLHQRLGNLLLRFLLLNLLLERLRQLVLLNHFLLLHLDGLLNLQILLLGYRVRHAASLLIAAYPMPPDSILPVPPGSAAAYRQGKPKPA